MTLPSGVNVAKAGVEISVDGAESAVAIISQEPIKDAWFVVVVVNTG
jgi:hypothetical protein